jgi:hypothetical protein
MAIKIQLHHGKRDAKGKPLLCNYLGKIGCMDEWLKTTIDAWYGPLGAFLRRVIDSQDLDIRRRNTIDHKLVQLADRRLAVLRMVFPKVIADVL